MRTQVLILGSGPAGLTAALYSALAGFQTTVLTGEISGGQLTLTNEIENFPGFTRISGTDLTNTIHLQAQNNGAVFFSEKATSVDISTSPFHIQTQTNSYLADSLIIATGAYAKHLNIPGEDQLFGHGISICATCDGVFYKNKTVAVIGDGNSAMYEALYLSQTASLVYLIIRGPNLSVDPKLQKQILSRPNIVLITNTSVSSFLGTTKLKALHLKHLNSGKPKILKLDGAFEAIGRIPDSKLFQDQLQIDSQGYIVTDCQTGKTSKPGVFACGDVSDPLYHQAILACSSGCRAALSAKRYLLSAFS